MEEGDIPIPRRERRRNKKPNLPAPHREPPGEVSLTVTQTQWAGRFPHPEDMERYEALYPGTFGIIVEDFLAQSRHRMRQEERVVGANILYRYLALGAGVLGLIGVLITVVVLANIGVTESYLLGVAAILTAAATTLYGIRANQKERELKREEARKALPPDRRPGR